MARGAIVGTGLDTTHRCDPADATSICAWLATWDECVVAVDFDRARPLFDSGVVGFGTYSDVVTGLDNLEQQQWRKVWPTIRDFRFDLEGIRPFTSPDRLFGYLAASWSSTGIGEDGTTFDRPGRCTVVLRRAQLTTPWLGVHTHISLFRGVPQRSHGGSGTDQPSVV